MQAMSDMELLKEYALRKSEEAFATLVSRHIDLVYSAALRHIRNHHQAEEITQAVFVILARKARSLGSRTVLAGWLFQTARLTAANYLRTEIRRTRREQEAYMQSTPEENPGDPWQQVAPVLNDTIAGLGEKDRNAIVLRFLQGKDFKEVGAALGASEEAAQMRVGRALEKLRKLFVKRGVVLSVAALGGVIAAQGTHAAPVGLAASITAGAVQGASLTASTLTLVKGTLKAMAWTKVQFAVGAGVLILLVYQQHQNAVEAKQLASARDELRARTEDYATQTSRIADLEQQTTAMIEIRREQSQELEQLRARRKAASGPEGSNPAAGRPTTMLSATLQDPDAREYLRRQLVDNSRIRLGPLIKELKLSDEDAEKVLRIGGDWGIKNLEAVAAFTDGTITAEAAAQTEAVTELNSTNQIREVLGETNMPKFDACIESYPARRLVQQFDQQLGFFKINADQRERLSQLIDTEPYDISSAQAGDLTIRALVYPEELQQRFAQQVESNQQILQGAAEFLAPDQIEALRLMQASNLSMQKRDVLRLLRKL